MHRDLLGYSGLVASGVGTHSLFRQPTTYEHQWHEPCLSTMYDAASCLPVTTTLPACHLILLPPAPPDYQGTHYSLFTIHCSLYSSHLSTIKTSIPPHMCPVRHRLNSLLHADAHLHLFIPLSSRYGIHPAIGLSLLGYAYLCAMCGSLQMQDPSENLALTP